LMSQSTHKYGLEFYGDHCSDVNIELRCFLDWHDTEAGGLGRFGHFKNAVKLLTPDIQWNPWTEMRARAFCDENNWFIEGGIRFLNIANMGCGSSGKTHDWSWFAVIWWLADILNSSVVVCSIRKQMITQRTWSVVNKVYNMLPVRMGKMVNSKVKWLAPVCDPSTGADTGRFDDKHAIFAQAVERGEVEKTKQLIAGLHPKRMMLIVDEAPGTPEAIFEIIPNMLTGIDEMVLVTNGNAVGRLTPHGRICQPVEGWNSVDESTELYRTAPVPEWGIPSGVCIHYHGCNSPNVKAGRNLYEGLYKVENWTMAQTRKNTLNYWWYDAGWFAPDGMANTVMEESTVMRADGMGSFVWESWSRPCAALDPAISLGGDDPAFYFGEMGDLPGGRTGLQLKEKVPVRIKASRTEPAELQIARQVIDECKRRDVKPEDFALDATGTGHGVWAFLVDMWSPNIVKVEFNGVVSDSPISENDRRPCKEVYDRKVTELWFKAPEMLHAGQLKGLTRDAVDQFCRRTYDTDGRKLKIEKKSDYKARFGRSPDDADCVVVMCEMARRRGLVVSGEGKPTGSNRWLAEAKKYDDVFPDEDERREFAGAPTWFDDME